MGMFDKPKSPSITEEYPPDSGKHFICWRATYLGIQEGAFGPQEAASLLISTTEDPELVLERHVWSFLAMQVKGMDDEDLPAIVGITKDGRRNLFYQSEKYTGDVPLAATGDTAQVGATTEDDPGF